jgi:hypothetical protein
LSTRAAGITKHPLTVSESDDAKYPGSLPCSSVGGFDVFQTIWRGPPAFSSPDGLQRVLGFHEFLEKSFPKLVWVDPELLEFR